MAHKINRLASSILSEPQLITADAYNVIAQYLTKRITDADFVVYEPDEEEDKDRNKQEMIGEIGVIPVSGSLSYKPIMTMCGAVGASYTGLIAQTQEVIDAGAKLIIYDFNTPGGMASHCFETANTIRDMLDEAEVESVAYIDEMAASAGFALACVMDEVIANPSADAGSIGCVLALENRNKEAIQKGELKFITSTNGKVPFTPEGEFSEGFISRLQNNVSKLGTEFISHVSKYTGLDSELIASFDAQLFNADEALENGLVNKVMTHKEFTNYIKTKVKE